jgi:D-glycero-alpha-D-manno-heptose-7-phosphate kinase
VSRQQAEATAPCRVDLAGGTLDVWPIYLFWPGAVTVSVAVDRRAWCRVELGGEGVHVESKDTLQKASAASVEELSGGGRLSVIAHVLRVLEVEPGVRVVTRSPVPEGAGLGASSAVAVAVAAAVSAAQGRTIDPERLGPLLRDAESVRLQRPTGSRDYAAALRGGTVALHLEPGEVRVEVLAVDPARVEESMLFVDSGGTAPEGPSEWDAVKGQIDGDDRVREALAALATVARGLREALVEGRFEDVVDLFAAEWDARRRLAPGGTTPEIDRVVAVARDAGGAAKPCGAAGGSVLAVWAPPGARGPGRREAVQDALAAAGFRVFPARVDLRGLEVS